MLRRFVLRRRKWWPPSKRVLYRVEDGNRRGIRDGVCADDDPGGRVAASGVGGDGHGGPEHAGLHAHTDHRRAGRWCVRRGGARAARPDQDDGPVLHQALASARRDGVVHRHRDRGGAGDHADQRCADPRLPGRRQPGVPAAERHHPSGHRPAATARTVRQPNVLRAVGDPRIPGPQLRRHRPARRRADAPERKARQGTDPGVRRTEHRSQRREPDGGAAERTRTHRRLRPQAAGDRPDHRHGVDQPGGRPIAGDDVQRRHRDSRIAVFLSAELDFVSRRSGEVDGIRAG